MPDLHHLWGSDLAWSPTGDIVTATSSALTQQRILRRLLTNQADYLWQLDYGASLPAFVGQPGAALAIRAAIRSQLSKEASVGQVPAPVIELTPDPTGNLYVNVRYADAASGATRTLTFTA